LHCGASIPDDSNFRKTFVVLMGRPAGEFAVERLRAAPDGK